MRARGRVDANQRDIVAALRWAGASVQPLSSVGGGCPDILIGWRGRNIVAELKDGSKEPARRRLTADEAEWHRTWQGQVAVVESVGEALALLEE